MVKLEEIREKIDKIEPTCMCGNPLDRWNLDWYGPHSGGWGVEDIGEGGDKSWLYLHCSSCGYDLALHKIGITRPDGELKEV